MRTRLLCLLLLATAAAAGAPVRHTIFFGKWVTVKVAAEGEAPAQTKVRPLYVDGRLREYTLGEPHEVTDQVLVVRQAYRVNDALPGERGPQWQWQRGGWLLVERASGRVRRLLLPDFDPARSEAVWYRDYAAYCGGAEGEPGKRYAVVAQLGRRSPLLRQELGTECTAPSWQRGPTRVTFPVSGKEPRTYQVRGQAVDPAQDEEPKAEESPQ